MDREKFKSEAIDRFTNQDNFAYYGDLDAPPWGVLGFVGQHRDSDPMERSNFKVIANDLLEKFPESFEIESSSHWAVGWVECIRINTDDDDAVTASMDWATRLENYPVADEEHFSNLEHEEREEYYQGGGRKDALGYVEDMEEFAHIFDSEGELIPEFEDYVNWAFHDAEQDGSLSYFAEHLEEQLERKKDDDRREYERYQPPLMEMEV